LSDETAVVGIPVTAPLQANVWKIYVKEGDKIEDDDQRIVELEAMKTSVRLGCSLLLELLPTDIQVWITPGDDTVGKVVKTIRVKEGEAVGAGTVLLELE
jgi:urea carboxylase